MTEYNVDNMWSKKVDMYDTAARYSTSANKNTLQLELKRQNKIAKYKKEQEWKKKIQVGYIYVKCVYLHKYIYK